MIASGGQASCRTPGVSSAKRLECPLGIGALAEIEQSDFTRTRYIGVVPARLLRAAPCASIPQLTTGAAVTFLWPEQLWLALLLPLLAMLYVWLLFRRRKFVLRLGNLGPAKLAAGKSTSWRRHLPPLLLLLGFAALVVASARPMAVITLPTDQQTIMLAMDVSGSMRATDITPDRISASQLAAKRFVTELPRNVRIGVVAYAGTAQLVQPPTLSREDVAAAIDRFQLQRGTAIGSGIVIALATIFPRGGIDLSQLTGDRNLTPPLSAESEQDRKEFKPVAPGSYGSAAIVLLTDGQNTAGPDPMTAAQMAADRGIKIFTVGFGTKEGEVVGFEGWSMRVRLDERTLQNIANLTQGQYFYAGSGADLKQVYEALRSRLVLEKRETEVTALFADLAGLLILLAAALSLWWFGKVV
jgi:Ca-activated chloride channel homolog